MNGIDILNKIKERREFLGFSKEWISKYLLNCSVQYLDDIESGRVNDIQAIKKLCNTFSIPMYPGSNVELPQIDTVENEEDKEELKKFAEYLQYRKQLKNKQ